VADSSVKNGSMKDGVATPPAAARPPIRRRPRDLIGLGAAAGIVVLCALVARTRSANPVEIAIFEEFQRIPAASTIVWRVLAVAGGWVGIAAVTALLLYLRRIRVGVQCAAAGALAWVLADGVGRLVGPRPVPVDQFEIPVRLPADGGFTFPAPHAAVAAAMVAVAVPYLRALYRRLAWAAAVLVGAADVYLGTSLPLDAFAGVFLGVAVGAMFRLAWGTPGQEATEPAVRLALERAGLSPLTIGQVRERRLGPLEFVVTTADGQRLRVEAVRRLHRRAGPWYRLRRALASVEVEDEPALSSVKHETDHEALVMLFAQRSGVRVPPLVLTCEARHGAPLLVRRQIDGRRLPALPPDKIDDRLLDAIWEQVALLGDARIAHHDLRAKNIQVDTEGNPWLLDFTFAKVGASAARTAQDVAEMLLTLTALVGFQRAVQSACRVLSPDRLEPALPYLQPLALPRRIRKQLGAERLTVAELREALAEQIDRPLPTLRSPVRPASLISLLLLGAAVYALLPQLSSMGEVVRSFLAADWWWLVVATVAGLLAIVASAVSVMGSSPTALPFWRTTGVQIAAAFTGRTTPGGVGFFAINIAFMERLGMRRASAVGVTVLNMAALSVIGGLWCAVGLLAIGASSSLQRIHIPHGWPVVAGVAVVVVAAVAVLASPFGRRKFVEPAWNVTRELLATLRQPVRAVQLFGGTTGNLVVSGLGLAACVAAFGAPVPLIGVVAVFMVGQTLGHVVPIPGGLGPTEALMIGGLTTLGTAPTVAVASTLAARLLTYWLPVLPGIVVFRFLQHRGIV
jgi:glycosyltransferase 2 family protein